MASIGKSLVLGMAIAIASASQAGIKDLKPLSIKYQGGRLLAALSAGVAVGDADNGATTFKSTGRTGTPSDMLWENNRVWWIDSISGRVYAQGKADKTPLQVALLSTGQHDKPVRLGKWNKVVTIHTPTGTCYVDSKSLKVLSPTAVIPQAVHQVAQQGMVVCDWNNGRGMFVAIRRYGSRNETAEGAIRDIVQLSAWRVQGSGSFEYLGAYIRSLVPIQERPGPEIQIDEARKQIRLPYGSGPLGNIKIGPEGIIALDADGIMLVPFTKKSWLPDEVETPVRPGYAQSLAYFGSNAWWIDGDKVQCANLEDGSVDTYLAPHGTQIKSVAPDDDGAWIVTSMGVKRIIAGEEGQNGFDGFMRYRAGDASTKPDTSDQANVLDSIDIGLRGRPKSTSGWDWVRTVLNDAGLGAEAQPDARKRIRGEIRVGDAIVGPNFSGIYVGDGRAARYENGVIIRGAIRSMKDMQVYRYAMTVPVLTAFNRAADERPETAIVQPAYGTMGRLANRAFPLGVNRPNPSLGHNYFVRVNTNSPYDRPYLPMHNELLSRAKDWIGTPYVWGGNTKSGADCSGFVRGVFKEIGISLPRHSQDMGQVGFGQVVTDELRFGDVLVYPYPKHVAIYVGGGKTIEAVRGGVGYSNVWRRKQAVVRRFIF